MAEEKTGKQRKAKALLCVVSSDKMLKSRTATLVRLVREPTYGKYLRRTSKVMFHDANNETKVGDKVLIEPSKPLSARKRFTLVKIVEKAKV